MIFLDILVKMKNLLLVIFLLPLISMAQLPSKKEIYLANVANVQANYEKQTKRDQEYILSSIEQMNALVLQNKTSFTQLYQEEMSRFDKPIFLLIQGLPTNKGKESFYEWYAPLVKLKQMDFSVYFHRLSSGHSYHKNSLTLQKTMRELIQFYPDRKIIAVGYSAGGSVGLHAYQEIKKQNLETMLYFASVASPLYGYNAPQFMKVFGFSFKITMGLGVRKRLDSKLTGCLHFTTNNPSLDIHARRKNGLSPQLGPYLNPANHPEAEEASSLELPCGNHNIINSDNDTHMSILGSAINNIIDNNY